MKKNLYHINWRTIEMMIEAFSAKQAKLKFVFEYCENRRLLPKKSIFDDVFRNARVVKVKR